MAKWDLSRKRPTARDGAVSKPWRHRMSIRMDPVSGQFVPFRNWSRGGSGARHNAPESLAKQVAREFHQRLAGRDLFARLVLHHHVDQNPAGFFGALLGLDDSRGLYGVARPDRLDPPRFQPPVDAAGGVRP